MKPNRIRSPRLRAALACFVLFAMAGCNPLSCLVEALEPGWLTEIRQVHLPADPVVQQRLGAFSLAGTKMHIEGMGKKTKNAKGVVIDIAPTTTDVTLSLKGKKASGEVHITVRDPEWADEQMAVTAMSLHINGEEPIALALPRLENTAPPIRDALLQSRRKLDDEIAALAELDSEVAARLGTPLVIGDRLNNNFHLSSSDRESRETVRLKVRGPKSAGIVSAVVVTPPGERQRPRVTDIAFESTL